MIDSFLRFTTLIIFVLLFIYWRYSEWQTYKKLPIEKKTSFLRTSVYGAERIGDVLLAVQLLGFLIFPIQSNTLTYQIIGFCLVLLGVGVCIKARKDIGIHWSNAKDYQIKKGQELVTHGIYTVIRHPIYVGVWLCAVGGELVAKSYLAIILGLVFGVVLYIQSKEEEKLLLVHFGEKYKTYLKKTSMFIPSLF